MPGVWAVQISVHYRLTAFSMNSVLLSLVSQNFAIEKGQASMTCLPFSTVLLSRYLLSICQLILSCPSIYKCRYNCMPSLHRSDLLRMRSVPVLSHSSTPQTAWW